MKRIIFILMLLILAGCAQRTQTVEVHQGNEGITLTAKEIDMIDYLILNSNRVVSHDELKLNIWKDSFEATDSALKNLLNKLRKKIGKDTIINISGIGYRLNI